MTPPPGPGFMELICTRALLVLRACLEPPDQLSQCGASSCQKPDGPSQTSTRVSKWTDPEGLWLVSLTVPSVLLSRISIHLAGSHFSRAVFLNAVEVGSEVHLGTPKGHQRRSVPFPAFLADALLAQTKDKLPDALLFPGSDGHHLRRTRTHSGSKGWFASAVRRAGIPHVTPHDLRHTAASLAISSGANVKADQQMLGHKSAAMTLDTYAGLFPDDLDAVASALDRVGARFMRPR